MSFLGNLSYLLSTHTTNLTRKRCQNKRQEADAGHQTEKRQFNAIEQAYEQRQSKLIKRSDKPEKD
jgi:hypothetical protein